MTYRLRSTLLLAFCLVIASTAAKAEIRVGESIEWLVADADVIVRCRLVQLTDDDPTPSHLWKRAEFQVSEILKGKPPSAQRILVRISGISLDSEFQAWRAAGGERIIFLRRTHAPESPEDNSYDADLAKYPLQLTDSWMCPSPRHSSKVGFTADFHVLRTAEEIDAAIRAAIHRQLTAVSPKPGTDDGFFGRFQGMATQMRPGGPWSIWIDTGFGNDVSRELYSGSVTYLILPLDSDTERLAYEWSSHPDRLPASLSVLRYFKTQRSIRLFKSLLDDPQFRTSGYGGPATEWTYFLRQQAYGTLRAWGINTARPAISMPDDPYRELSPLQALGLPAAGMLMLTLAARIARRKAGAKRRGFGVAAVDAACVALLVLAAGAGIAACQSPSVPEATVSMLRARYWAWMHDRRFTVARAQDWQVASPLMVARFDGPTCPSLRWSTPTPGRTTTYEFIGFVATTGTLTPHISTPTYSGPGTPSPYVTASVPLWGLLTILLFLPLARLAVAGRQAIRRRARVRLGQCLACGYDLRGSDSRCPECGQAHHQKLAKT